jgi:hypothetical protein
LTEERPVWGCFGIVFGRYRAVRLVYEPGNSVWLVFLSPGPISARPANQAVLPPPFSPPHGQLTRHVHSFCLYSPTVLFSSFSPVAVYLPLSRHWSWTASPVVSARNVPTTVPCYSNNKITSCRIDEFPFLFKVRIFPPGRSTLYFSVLSLSFPAFTSSTYMLTALPGSSTRLTRPPCSVEHTRPSILLSSPTCMERQRYAKASF